MKRIVTSQRICVSKLVLFYTALIIVIVVSENSFSFVYCVSFGIQVYHCDCFHDVYACIVFMNVLNLYCN